MQVHWEVEIWLNANVNFCLFTPEETAPGIHSIEGWAGTPNVGLDTVVAKRKISAPAGYQTPIIHPVASHLNE
jgi:hypothetical protein